MGGLVRIGGRRHNVKRDRLLKGRAAGGGDTDAAAATALEQLPQDDAADDGRET